MRDRLIELLDIIIQPGEKTLGDIADHLLANGVVVLPCKVGDKLYTISSSRIEEVTCHSININDEIDVWTEFNCDYDCKGCPFSSWKQDFHTGEYSCDGEYGDWCFSLDDFGKTVFLTREEAEKALAERSKG